MTMKAFNRALAGTTALISIALFSPADAQGITINSPSTTPVILQGGQSLHVTDTGSISSPGNAVFVGPGERASGIVNDGVITGHDGVRILTGSLTGGFTNTGSLTGAFFALSQSNISGGITNSGTIDNITLAASYMSGDMFNTGTITDRLALSTSDMKGSIENSGFIEHLFIANDPLAPQNLLSGSVSNESGGLINAVDVYNEKISGIFANGNGASIGTLAFNSHADVSGGIINSGDISQINVSNSNLTGSIVNNAAGDIGALDIGASLLKKDILNYGTIGQVVITSSGLESHATLRNMGLIGDGVNPALIVAETTGAVSGAIYNSGTIDGGSGDAVLFQHLLHEQDFTLEGGRVIGNIFDDNIANGLSNVIVKSDFKTEGDIDVSALHIDPGVQLTVGAGHEVVLDHMGSLGGGELGFEVSDVAPAGLLRVANGAVNLSGNTLFAVQAAGAVLTDGMEALVADGAFKVIGGPGDAWRQIKDNSPFWNFFIGDGTLAATPTDDTDLFIRVAAGDPLLDSSGRQTRGLAEMIESLSSSADPDIQQINAAVAAATTTQQIARTLNSLVPTVDGAAQRSAQMFTDESLDIAASHLDSFDNESTGISSGDAASKRAAWGQVFGQSARQGEVSGTPGYRSHTAGVAFGAETEAFLQSTLGLAVMYGSTGVESHNVNDTSTDIDSYQISLYGQHDLPKRVYLRGMAAYAYNANDTKRHNVGGLGGPTASGSFSADQYALRLETGKSYSSGRAVITPDLMGTWLHYAPDSYTENGAGGLNLHVSGKSSDVAEVGAGFTVRWGYEHTDGTRIIPDVHAAYRYDLVGDSVDATAALAGGGGAFAVPGAALGRGRVTVGTGLSYVTTANWDFSANYDMDAKDNYVSHSGRLRATFKF